MCRTLTLHVVGSGDWNSRGKWPGAGGAVHSLFHVVSRSHVGTPNMAYPNPLSIIRYCSNTESAEILNLCKHILEGIYNKNKYTHTHTHTHTHIIH